MIRNIITRKSAVVHSIPQPHVDLCHDVPVYRADSVHDLVKDLRPSAPLYVFRPDILADTARHFLGTFPGKALLAVKTNPTPFVIKTLAEAGVVDFDVASIEEVRLVKTLVPNANLYFMHPIKSPEAIEEAYFEHGVRHFVLDSKDELFKIMRHTKLAQDLTLYVRLSLPKNDNAAIDFSGKFGASPQEACILLKECASVAQKLGLSFHVGTQATDPNVYFKAIGIAADVIKSSAVNVDILNVGGGFPVPYDEDVPPLSDFVAVIKAAIQEYKLTHMDLISEPGRYMSARGASLVVRVEHRKDDLLYINDGTYGGLFDAGPLVQAKFEVTHVPVHIMNNAPEIRAFRLAGPTCDSLDMMDGPFMLPDTIQAGDWIEIHHMGAYSLGMRTNFNGFGHADMCSLNVTD